MVPLSLLEIIGNDRNKTETIVEDSFYLGDKMRLFLYKKRDEKKLGSRK